MIKRSVFRVLALIYYIFLYVACSCGNDAKITSMRCEYLSEPICIDTEAPRFTWTYTGCGKFVQYSFRVVVASSKDKLENPDIWDSGEVVSRRPFCKMDGKALLLSDNLYYWRVEAKDENSSIRIVSDAASFYTAMMRRSDWKAVWISDGASKELEAAPMFRKEFKSRKSVASAKIFMSAAAYALVRINGKPVSDRFLEPGYTHYDKRNLYSVMDVTSMIRIGSNTVSAVLGNGFYNVIKPVASWQFENAPWRDRARFILELRIKYKDGSSEVVSTDGTWKTSYEGPYINNNIYAGDTYDARKEIPGWELTGFNDSMWNDAVQVPDPSPLLVAQKMPPIRSELIMRPEFMRSFGDTVHIFDFGKNISGFCRLKINGSRGTKVSLAHAELLGDEGRLEPGNINIYYNHLSGYDFQTDRYILKGEGIETWNPAFCYHGFRYVEVKTSEPVKLEKTSLSALYFHTALKSSGRFECSDKMLNILCDMTKRTYLNNLMSIPTDCPQREKNGWTADAYLAQEIGLLNYDSILFYEKWLDDFIDNQREDGRISGIIPSSGWGYDDWIGPVWDAAMFIIPYNLYLYYGDKTGIEKMWPVCKKYLDYMKTREDEDGLVTFGIGDWLPYNTETPTEYTSSLFYYYDYKMMSLFAGILGEEEGLYSSKAESIREAVNRKFYDHINGLYANGSQTAQAAALFTGVVPDEETDKVAGQLNRIVEDNSDFLDFGSMGSKIVLRMLTKYGYSETAFRMSSKRKNPSWLAWINRGYTSLPETWILSPDFRDASLNHVFLGDIAAWLVNDIAGIRADESEPGFGRVVIAPHFVENLDRASASYASVRGDVAVSWKKERGGGKVVLKVALPDNTEARVLACGEEEILGPGRHTLRYRLP